LSAHHRLEAGNNNFYLIVTGYDEGAINIPIVEPGIVLFTKTNENMYVYKGVEQTFTLGDKKDEDLYCFYGTGIIVAKSDNPSIYKIINLKHPNQAYNFRLKTYTPLAVSPNHTDRLLMCEYINPYKFKVSSYNTLTGTKTIVATEEWTKALSPESFFITDAIRFCRMGMGQVKYLPPPPSTFLNVNNIQEYVLTQSPDKLQPDEVKTITRVSLGDNTIYFISSYSTSAILQIWIYNQVKKEWTFDEMPLNACETIGFGNNLAVRHAEIKGHSDSGFKIYTGLWSLYISGKRVDVFCGRDSRVLYLTKEKLIFSNSSRLYECVINKRGLSISKPHLIAEHNYIRYAKSLFFQYKKQD
jgi:hypothetical protein